VISLGSERWTSSSPNITLSFAYEKQRSGADMQYRAKITVSEVSGSSYFGYPIYLKLSIDGTLRVTKTLKSSSPDKWTSAITYTSPWYTVSNKTTGTTPVSFKVYSGAGSSRTATYSYKMDVDPAASEISAPNGTLGTALTLRLTRYNTSFTNTVSYVCGTARGEIVAGSTADSLTWNTSNGNTVALAAQNTTGRSVSVTFTVTTYSGTTVIGSSSTSVSMTIPATVKPSVTLSLSDAAGFLNTYGAYVQGYSKLKIVANATSAYGSPITGYTINADGGAYTTNPVTTPALQGTGALTVTAKVTDARSNTSNPVSSSITVLEYANPVAKLSAYRCNSAGVADPEGAYMKIGLVVGISSLNGRNSASYSISYTNNAGATETITGAGLTYTSPTPIACDISNARTISVTVTDRLSRTTASVTVPIAYTLTDYYNTGKGIAFGKVATRDGFDCAMPAYFTGGITVGSRTLLDLIYPVGSIYMSMNNVSPQTFFGGTWERLLNRFLIGAGDTYGVGAMDGYATHTLTTDELPPHRHDRITYAGNGGWFIGDNTGLGATQTGENVKNYNSNGITSTTTSASLWATNIIGGGQAHNNMPPYLAVYMWKRTK
jgi:microcystin-dependent protein